MVKRERGEFRTWGFLISFLVFFCLGWFLYSRFTFATEPAKPNQNVQSQVEDLTQRVGGLEKRQSDIQEKLKECEEEIGNGTHIPKPTKKSTDKQQKHSQ